MSEDANNWLRERFPDTWTYVRIAEWIIARAKTCSSQQVAWAREFLRTREKSEGD